jgi:site-specific recombinase XerD
MPHAKWDDVLDQFKAALQADEKSPNTVRNYAREVRAFGEWYHSVYEEAPDLAGMTADDLREYKRNLQDRKLKPQSVNLAIVSLRSLIKWGCETRLLHEAVKTPKAVKQAIKVPRWLAKPQERRLMKAVRKAGDPHHLGLVEMFLVFGLRISEMASEEWGDVTLGRNKAELRVRKGKGGKERVLPFLGNERAREALHLLDYKKWHKVKDRRLLYGQRGPLSAGGIKQLLTPYGRVAEIEPFSAHVLRHTCARRMHEAGKSIQVIARWLGHESLNTTFLYTLPSQDDLQEAAGGSAAGWGDDDDD